jgi:hypothetical protein
LSPAPFIAIDGEAIDGRYVLLADSTGRHLLSPRMDDLKTRDCFEFLLSIPRPSIPVCFGLNYDVNQWLSNLPRSKLSELWERHYTYHGDYRLEWIPGRWFSVKAIDGRFARVNEVFGFFQSSFVAALESWGFDAPPELQAMKRARGTFSKADERRVIAYCKSECRLLVKLMDELRAACQETGATPRSWIGAGSIATALLAREGVADHHAYDLDLADENTVERAILGAYFGGRVELLHQGVHSRVRSLDLRSAYPAAALELPSLRGARLRHRRRFAPEREHAIWRVRWDLDRGTLIAPFPVRHKLSIYYPLEGEGHYHATEVRAALAAGYPLEVLEGWVLEQKDDARPFSFVRRVYRERARLKAEGRAAEKALKLGLNSVYGKLAQGYGYGARPRWQSYFWAGYITARTRARVLETMTRTGSVVMVSTDGVFTRSSKPKIATEGAALGSWEAGALDLLFAAQPGVYQGFTAERELLKSRGFFAREVDYDELRAGFETEGAEYVHRYDSTRFVGLGSALALTDFGLWRRWVTAPRSLSLAPERKVATSDGNGGNLLYPCDGPLTSEPYAPKMSLLDARALDFTQGMEQPMREEI